MATDANEPQKINLVGYAIDETVVLDNVEFKGIPMVHHSVALDPTANQIQAKLIGSGTVVMFSLERFQCTSNPM